MVLGLMYIALPIAGWMVLLAGAKRLILYLADRHPQADQTLARLRTSPAARGVSVGAALIIPGSMLFAVLANGVVDDLRQLAWLDGLFRANGYFLWESIGWGFYGSLAASLLLDEGKLKRTLVGLNGVIFCWMALAVSFCGPLWFNVVYLIKVIVPLIPMDHLLSFWS